MNDPAVDDPDPPPLLAVVLGVCGGGLVIAQSIVAEGITIPVLGGASQAALGHYEPFAAVYGLFGVVMIGLSAGLLVRPGSNEGLGLTLVVVSLFSLLTGGGFVLGTVLGAIGGGLARVYEPEGTDQPLPRPLPDAPETVPRAWSPIDPGISERAARWACVICGHETFQLDRYCRHCGNEHRRAPVDAARTVPLRGPSGEPVDPVDVTS